MRFALLVTAVLALAVAGPALVTASGQSAPDKAVETPVNTENAERDRVISIAPAVAQSFAVDGASGAQEAVLKAGQDAAFELSVSNTTRYPFNFKVTFRDMQAPADPARDKQLVPAGQAERGAGTWLSVEPDSFSIRGETKRSFPVHVAVPDDALPGGHYAAVEVAARSVNPRGVVRITTQLTTLVLITVDGGIRHKFDVSITPKARATWSQPLEWELLLHNRGNVHEIVGYNFAGNGLFGTEPTQRGAALVVFPGSTRRIGVRKEVRDAPDLFRPKVSWRTAGEDGDVGTSDDQRGSAVGARTLYFPWWMLALVALAVAVTVARLRSRGESGNGDADEDEWDEFDD